MTYGLTSSSFLATRCLAELANRFGTQFPLAANALRNHTWIDDIITGASSVREAIELKRQLVQLLELGSFELHKWCSNHLPLLHDIPKDKLNFDVIDLDKDPIVTKTLGIVYDTKSDAFLISCPDKDVPKVATKRSVLSFISRFYDPLGLVSPLLIRAKILLQCIWGRDLGWGDSLPEDIAKDWFALLRSVAAMPTISVHRCLHTSRAASVELVGYCDSSSEAFGCCLYARVKLGGETHCNLLCSKTRVKPLNSSLSVPQLELNSALLLARLYAGIKGLINNITQVTFYTDSQISLSWIETNSLSLKPYVYNRTRLINQLTEGCSWRHVAGTNNPADILTRGCDAVTLQSSDLWWHGPRGLPLTLSAEGALTSSSQGREGGRPVTDPGPGATSACGGIDVSFVPLAASLSVQEDHIWPFLTKYSSYTKLQNVMCYIMRFIDLCKNKNVNKGCISAQERRSATAAIIKCVQAHHFSNEISLLKQDNELNSHLATLHPYLDADGLIRVGGRLQNAQIPVAQMHPIILPGDAHVTLLLIKLEHHMLLHGGLKLTLSSLSQKYWIVSATRQIKKVIHQCMRCFRGKNDNAKQLMGTLPADRVKQARPFQTVGIDYCGPFQIKQSRLRRSLTTKGYVAVFVCFSTKAVHMELVSDMTTDCFLAAFKRFCARRGCPSSVVCDNAATFKGASNELRCLYELHNSGVHQSKVCDHASLKGINFKFVPSYSPNFAGLAESAVKAAKHNFKRIIGTVPFTYEEFNTIIACVESILNSRPLTQISSDPSDFTYLTPGHFLVGAAPNSYPERDTTEVPINRLTFWRRCTQIQQHFWRIWRSHYLSSLNQRTKWLKTQPNLKEGMLVLLKDDNVPSLHWPVGRVSKVYPGADQRVRVVDVRTKTGIYRRSISKIVG